MCDLKDLRFGKNKRVKSVYLLRIGVRIKCQRHGIGKKLMNYLFQTYPEHALSLDVNAESTQAINFYRKNGLRIKDVYVTPEPDLCEFATFETPLDKKGNKLDLNHPEFTTLAIQTYFDSLSDFKLGKVDFNQEALSVKTTESSTSIDSQYHSAKALKEEATLEMQDISSSAISIL